MHGRSHFVSIVKALVVHPFLHKQIMATSSDAAFGNGGVAAVAVVVVPELEPVGLAAASPIAADDNKVQSLKLKFAEYIRSLTQQRDSVKVIKATLSRKLKNARKSLNRLKQKATAPRDADLLEITAMRCDASGVSLDSELTAAAGAHV